MLSPDVPLLPTPVADHSRGLAQPGTDFQSLPNAVIALLPTPAVNDMGAAYTPETWDEWTATMKAKHNNGNGHGKSLNVEAQPLRLDVERDRLLPTPTRRDHKDSEIRREPHRPNDVDTLARALTDVPAALFAPEVNVGTGGTASQSAQLSGWSDLSQHGADDAPAEAKGRKVGGPASGALLPTPRATDGTKGGPNQRGSSGDLMLPSAVQLLPTPKATNNENRQSEDRYGPNLGMVLGTTPGYEHRQGSWGEYEPAIRRWEAITRPAPEPTKPNAKGNPKLSDEFDEWLMGLPAGWITDVPGVTWNEALKACGNGVVPQQAVAGIVWLRDMARWAA